MRDERPREAEDARIAGERAFCEFWQLAIVAGRQVVADLADLFLDEVIVVEQPFGGRHHAPAALQFFGARAVGREQDGGVVVEPRVQRQNSRWRLRHRLRGGEALRVLLEPFDTEQLFAHRRTVGPRRRRQVTPRDMSKNCVHGHTRCDVGDFGGWGRAPWRAMFAPRAAGATVAPLQDSSGWDMIGCSFRRADDACRVRMRLRAVAGSTDARRPVRTK